MNDALLQLSGVVVDLVFRAPRPPAAGEDVLASAFAPAVGGGFNAMAAARREGLRVVYGGGLGTGPFADRVAAALAAEGIEALQPRQAEEQGVCVVIVDDTGERSFVSKEGADGVLSPAALAPLRGARWGGVIVSGYPLIHARSAAALTAWLRKAEGARLFFDPTPAHGRMAPEAMAAALHRAAWVSANAAEAAEILGRDAPGEALASDLLARMGPSAEGAVVRLGPEGCALATRDGALRVPGFPAEAVDTNGAGDAHLGVFAAGLIRGLAPEGAARRANAAAALAVARPGPATAPRGAETDAALAAQGHAPDGRARGAATGR